MPVTLGLGLLALLPIVAHGRRRGRSAAGIVCVSLAPVVALILVAHDIGAHLLERTTPLLGEWLLGAVCAGLWVAGILPIVWREGG